MSNSIHIPQIDGKDLWLTNYAMNNEDCTGYTLLNKHGDLNLRRFKAVFDYSLDLIALRDAYKKVYRNNRFSYIEEKPNRVDEYCQHVINVTFKYSVEPIRLKFHGTTVLATIMGNWLAFRYSTPLTYRATCQVDLLIILISNAILQSRT